MSAALVLMGLVAAAALAGRYGRLAAVLLAVVSVVWLAANGPMEGQVLFTVTATHGFTAADLVGLTGLLLAVVLFLFPRAD